MLWLLPAIFGIIISLFFLYKLNRKKRKNLIKICFSGLFLTTIIYDILSIIRHLTQDADFGILLSKGIMSVVPVSATFFFLAPYIMLFRTKVNRSIILFSIPTIILVIMVWYPGMVYDSGESARYTYGVNPLLELLYAFILLSFMSIAPIMYFMSYCKYRDDFGSKLKYFFIGSFLGILTYLASLFIMSYIIKLPLIAQSIPTTIAILFIAIGYFKK